MSNHEFLDAGHKVKHLGSTGIALMLEYTGFRPPYVTTAAEF